MRERRGPDWLAAELGVPARTVSRVLRRHQVPYLADCDPLTGEVIRSSKTTAVRDERRRPGELVHMDAVKLGRIPDGGGWRARGGEHRERDYSTKVESFEWADWFHNCEPPTGRTGSVDVRRIGRPVSRTRRRPSTLDR